MSSEENQSRTSLLPTRYYVALIGALIICVYEGSGKSFAMILTHVTAVDSGFTEDLIFTNCTVFNTSRDMKIEMGEDTMFLMYATYYTGYLLPRPFVPFLISRFSNTRLMAICLVSSNILVLCVPYVIQYSIPLLFVVRFGIGSLDSAILPLILGLLSNWTTGKEKARLFSIATTGTYLSPGVAAMLSMYTMCYVSWDGTLHIFGVTGILTGVITLMTVYDTPEEHPSLPRSEVELHQRYRSQVLASCRQKRKIPWRHMFTSVPLWAGFTAAFSRSFIFFLLFVGFAQYFVDVYSINIADVALLTTVLQTGVSVFSMLGGMLSDLLLKFGLSATFTRKFLFTLGHLTEGVCLLGMSFANDWRTAVALMTVGESVGGLADAGYLQVASDVAPQYSTETSNLMTTGSLGGFASTLTAFALTGNYKDTAGWQKFFLTSGVICCVSVLFFDMAASAEVQPWAKETSSEEDTTKKTELDKLLPEQDKLCSCCTICNRF